ncbi:sulfite exporter TauE/SafE family protein [Bacillus sp. FJAT-49732]|uniref:Sulfite exporter TauE/SafE family protein n=1 Tax=Lederbergia citrisecunda TaxID=2833583 RepID=A0A942TTN6_9BACI|nr:sulfite exporter TauE/SafE family protein [Lederbergia citrisecunda]MBS4202027.1 sulfite exporter TauE/SafE family protein [Lederbergia citrisecunda]
MEVTLLSVLTLGFILGIKHAIEPDHVIAVSTIASRSKKLWHASLAGVFWGIGHTATLFIIGIILILMKNEISDKWSLTLEFFVGIMLVYLGTVSILSVRKEKEDTHTHHTHLPKDVKKKQGYYKSLIVGLIHGLAGSAAMVLLTMSTVHTVWHGVLFILIFGLGTIAGMLFFTTLIGIPFILSINRFSMSRSLIFLTGGISALFGLYYMYDLGFNEGLFALWI